MNRCVIAVVFLFFAMAAYAIQLNNPDPNTLWLENGKDIKLSKYPNYKCWYRNDKKALEIKSLADGKGFSFFAQDVSGRKTSTQLKLSPEYPYLVFKITGFEILKGYTGWAVLMQNIQFLASQVTVPHKGIFVYDLYRNLSKKEAAQKNGYLNIFLYNIKLNFEYIKLVKKPAYVVVAECADSEIKLGSKVKFIATLAEEAEDVSISLTTAGKPRPVKINGAKVIQLKPVDKTQKVWSAEIEVKSLDLKKACKRHQVFMKMDVLGGELDEAIWVGLPYAIKP